MRENKKRHDKEGRRKVKMINDNEKEDEEKKDKQIEEREKRK